MTNGVHGEKINTLEDNMREVRQDLKDFKDESRLDRKEFKEEVRKEFKQTNEKIHGLDLSVNQVSNDFKNLRTWIAGCASLVGAPVIVGVILLLFEKFFS